MPHRRFPGTVWFWTGFSRDGAPFRTSTACRLEPESVELRRGRENHASGKCGVRASAPEHPNLTYLRHSNHGVVPQV